MPPHPTELTDRMVAAGLVTSLGAVRAATVASVLTTTINREGDKRCDVASQPAFDEAMRRTWEVSLNRCTSER